MVSKFHYLFFFFGLIASLSPLCVYASIGQSVNEFYHHYTWRTNMTDLWCITISWNLFLSFCDLYQMKMRRFLLANLLVIVIFVVKGLFFHNFDERKNIVLFVIFLLLILIPSLLTTLQGFRMETENYSELKQTMISDDQDLEKGKESKDHASFLRLIHLGLDLTPPLLSSFPSPLD